MATISMRKLQSETENVLFDCGIAGINDMIRKSYYPTILQHLYAFEILADGIVVGYYMIGFKKITLSECPDEIGEYRSDMSDFCYSLHIRYFAVEKKYQHLGIGTKALGLLIKYAMEMCKTWPIRLITLDALKDKVDWYKRIGFITFNDADLTNSKHDVGMYLDCLLDPGALATYCL